jgi:menaquinone-9 beta-reductase
LKTENNLSEVFDVIIAGGGLAGLCTSILLSKAGYKVLLFEKKQYPFHKVCGEYVSNEVTEFLETMGFDPFKCGSSKISRLRISSPAGKSIYSKLDLGGFGLSRFTMDAELASLARTNGVSLFDNCRVNDIESRESKFLVHTTSGVYSSSLVIGSYGKRTLLDKKLHRNFLQVHTSYMGVKYHIRTSYPNDEIGLDNFYNGYCGIVKIEKDLYNFCYLYRRDQSTKFTSLPELEEKILWKNPVLRNLFHTSQFVSEPEVINEISFQKKETAKDNVIFCGDAAGLITPLCGNGMAMAIHSSKILSECIVDSDKGSGNFDMKTLMYSYERKWKKEFSNRLKWGRRLQDMFGNIHITSGALSLIHAIPPLEKWLIKKTHGEKI